MAHYRAHRSNSGSAALLTKLEGYASQTSPVRINSVQAEFQKNTAQVLSGLSAIGIAGVKAIDLPKLLPSDPYEPALNIMACVRAYFQGMPSLCAPYP